MSNRNRLTRRDVLHWAGAAAVAPLWNAARVQADELDATGGKRPKRVIVAGGGIGGLCCAYDLMKGGHDVILLEASGRTGAHNSRPAAR